LTFHQQYPQFWRLLAWCNLEQISCEDRIGRMDSNVFSHLRAVYMQGQTQRCFLPSVSFESYIFVLTAISFFYFSNMKTMSHSLQLDLDSQPVRDRMVTEILKQLSAHEE
jgi:hypothetical protein